ncbi:MULTISPECIES: DUF559 domain-containing protein [Prevotellaceae]|uniref:DUF559 domain-containing protein n=1 Tax=Prevotellaceae TaxID=171552 RepID=UPI000B87C6A2|nr:MULTISPECIES: DUF559 domain-containing protein [Prevotellaceae]QVJ79649.1 DUF559 domain-containing protein [Xylanibacter ruminicola]
MESIYRNLTACDKMHEKKQKVCRTKSERAAYKLLPDSMKARVERNPPIAFKDCKTAFFPDLFFREEKICVEIDGEYHRRRLQKDMLRDEVFAKHGFVTIRINNCDTYINVSFWERLVEGMDKINNRTASVNAFIDELRKMIDDEIKHWIIIDDECE